MTLSCDTVLSERYRLIGWLGSGGVADVYRAMDDVLNRPVAVKTFRFDAEGCDMRRIETEMRTLAGLHHPGLVTLYDAGVADRMPYLVMEFVAGPTLGQRLAAGQLSATDTAELGAQLAAALDYVHGRGVVHRDVKPANILFADTAVKLADFGIARMVDDPRITEHGSTVGTANYLSPEQLRGGRGGPASDVYSLGLVLLECLTGRLTYPGTGVEAALARLDNPPRIPRQLGQPWVELLTDMTATDPRQRPAARDVAAVLASFTPGTTLAPIATKPVRVKHASAHVTFRRATAAAGALATLGSVALILALMSSHHPRAAAATPTARPAASPPAYPAVAGKLGADLRRLERAIEGSPHATTQLRRDVLPLTVAAARRNYQTAYFQLGALNADVAADREAGTLSTAQVSSIRAAIAVLQADLRVASSSSPVIPWATPSVKNTPTPVQPQPASNSKTGGHPADSHSHGHHHSKEHG